MSNIPRRCLEINYRKNLPCFSNKKSSKDLKSADNDTTKQLVTFIVCLEMHYVTKLDPTFG